VCGGIETVLVLHSESLTLSERGGKWESDQEREREKGRLNEGHGGSV
jgi:hypothetical protein